MKVNLIDKLDRERSASIEEINKIESNLTNDAKQLLLTAATVERDVLREAGLDHSIKQVETVRGINLERDKFESTYGQKVFTKDEVREICQKYALKLLPSHQYKGAIDPVLGARIVEFFKTSKLDGYNFEANNNLYIMAPATTFDIEKKINPVSFKNTDPVLFYRITRRGEEPMYIPVHKWGNDFTVIRRAWGAIKFNFWTNTVFGTAWKAAIVLSMLAIFRTDVYNVGPVVISIILGFLWHVIYYALQYGGGSVGPVVGSEHKFGQEGWDKSYR